MGVVKRDSSSNETDTSEEQLKKSSKNSSNNPEQSKLQTCGDVIYPAQYINADSKETSVGEYHRLEGKHLERYHTDDQHQLDDSFLATHLDKTVERDHWKAIASVPSFARTWVVPYQWSMLNYGLARTVDSKEALPVLFYEAGQEVLKQTTDTTEELIASIVAGNSATSVDSVSGHGEDIAIAPVSLRMDRAREEWAPIMLDYGHARIAAGSKEPSRIAHAIRTMESKLGTEMFRIAPVMASSESYAKSVGYEGFMMKRSRVKSVGYGDWMRRSSKEQLRDISEEPSVFQEEILELLKEITLGYEVPKVLNEVNNCITSNEDSKVLNQANDSITSMHDMVAEVADGLESAASLYSAVKKVSQSTIPLHKRMYKLFRQADYSLPKRSRNAVPKRFRKATLKRMEYLSDSSSEGEWSLYRDSAKFIGTFQHVSRPLTLRRCSDSAEEEKAALVAVVSCASQYSAEHAVNKLDMIESGYTCRSKRTNKMYATCRGTFVSDSDEQGGQDYICFIFILGKDDLPEPQSDKGATSSSFKEPKVESIKPDVEQADLPKPGLQQSDKGTTSSSFKEPKVESIKPDVEQADLSKPGLQQSDKGTTSSSFEEPKVESTKPPSSSSTQVVNGTNMFTRPNSLPMGFKKSTHRNTMEKTSSKETRHFSCITGLPGSILDRYREFYKSSQCEKGVSCLRHADIPGLTKSLNFNHQECSDLKVVLATEFIAIDKNEHTKKGVQRFSSSAPKTGKSTYRGSQAQPSMDRGGVRIKGGPSYQPVSTSSTSSSTTPKPNYGSNRALVSSVTPLLHAQAFSKIVVTVDSHLDSSEDESLIPLLFISGLSHFKLLKYSEAKVRFSRCDQICAACDKMGDSALCNLYLGDIQFSSHHFMDASSHYQKASSRYCSDSVAALFRMMPPSLSTVHAKHGSALRNAFKMVDAIQEYKLAIKEAKTEKDKLAANTSLGNLYQSLGENTSALAHYEQSVELSEKLHDYVSLGWSHGNMGNAYLGLFQKDKALFHLQKSLELTLQYEPTPQAIGRTYNNLGTAYQSLGDLEKAQEQYDNALSQAIYGNDKPGQARVYGNMGNVLMLRKKYDEAVPHYSEVLLLSKDRSTLSTAHHNRGCAYYEWGENKMDKMYNPDSKAEAKKEEEEDQTEGKKPVTVKAKVYVHGPDFKDDPDLQPRKVTKSISKYYESGCEDLSEVVKYHEGHLDNIKGSSKGLTLSVSLFETNSRTFHRYQDCLVNLGDYTKALLVAEQSRARTLGELMLKRKGWHLQNPLTSPMPFDQVVATVECKEHPILYLSYTGARLLGWVFVPTKEGQKMNMFEVPLKDDQFDGKSFDYHLRYSLTEALVERSFEMYREVGDYDEFTSAPVQNLYNLIAKPLLTILDRCGAGDAHKLVVISDSYTALLPYSSLHDTETDTFLGDRFSFQLMPSLLTMSVLDQLPDANVVHLPTDPHNMCIVGNPNIPQFKYNNDVWNLGKLPHAKREAESVAHILKTKPILEAQATKSAVLMRIINAKIIHLATHGSASSGFLAFGMMVPVGQDKAANAQGVLLYPEEVEKLNISPALVVLSSCDSGRGTVKADGIQGMARAFILAGAQAVLTTLWRVPDESAAVFMQFFYQYMMDGLESTKALQKAILSVRCFSKYSQYIHWSGYQLTGRDVYFQYTSSESTHILEKRLGLSSVFPRLHMVGLLEEGLVDVNCFPTDIQILETSPGIEAHEVVIDFIHKSYKHFSSGIYWINCEHPEFITDSIKYIEKCIGTPLEQIQLSELRHCLFVFDGMSELPSSEPLLQLMGNRYAHCVTLYRHYKTPEKLIRAIDHKLLRGCKVHHLEPLSMILSTQRMVYTVQNKIHFPPKSNDQDILEKLSDFTSGSPVLVDIASRLLLSYLSDSSYKSLQDALEDFAEAISLYDTRDKRPSPLSASPSSSCSSSPTLSRRDLSSHMRDSVPSVSTVAPECRDEWDTACNYDSWDSISELLNACQFDLETNVLLNCLSHFGCGPIPVTVATSLSSLITKTSGKPHLAGSLLNHLMEMGFVKTYPAPVIVHSSIKPTAEAEFIYVPKYIGDYLWKELEDQDKAVALATTFQTLSQLTLQRSSFTLGLVTSLMQMCVMNLELMGEKCYREVYRLYLSLIQQPET